MIGYNVLLFLMRDFYMLFFGDSLNRQKNRTDIDRSDWLVLILFG